MLSITTSGSFENSDAFFQRMSKGDIYKSLAGYAERGVAALTANTPAESGETAAAWSYEIQNSGRNFSIYWINTHLDKSGTPIAILLQYGHGTGTGGYVQGRDYINPVMQPLFDEIANAVWKVVTA